MLLLSHFYSEVLKIPYKVRATYKLLNYIFLLRLAASAEHSGL